MTFHKSSSFEIHQPPKGYRYNIDSMLLARFAQFKEGEKVCDLGTGVGLLGILAILRGKAGKVWGLEVQEELAQYAEKNKEELKLGSQMEIIRANWKEVKKHLRPNSADLIISNPPYRKLKTGRISQTSLKAIASHELEGSLGDLLQSARYLMKAKGRFVVIYPTLRLEELITELAKQKLKIQRICFIHPYQDRPATHFMLEAVRSVSGEMEVEKPLIIFRDKDHYQIELEEWVGKKIRTLKQF